MVFQSIQSLTRAVSPLVAPAHTEVLRLEGQCKYSDRPLRAVYLGNGANLVFLRDLFLREAHAERLAEITVPALAAHRAITRSLPRTELLLTDVPRIWQPLLGLSCDVQIPAWIRQELALEEASERLWPRSTEKEIARHLRRQQYEIDITTEPSAFLLFFHNLYRPYVESRFGSQAVVVSEQTFARHSRGQLLARVYAHGRWVAGMLLGQQKKRLRFGWFGAITDPPPQGVSEVLDAFCIRYAKERGFTRVVLGNSRPNLNDGVLRYKAKFGARIMPTRFPQSVLGIKVREWSEDVVRCLAEQPLVTQAAGRCYVYRVQSMPASASPLQLEPV